MMSTTQPSAEPQDNLIQSSDAPAMPDNTIAAAEPLTTPSVAPVDADHTEPEPSASPAVAQAALEVPETPTVQEPAAPEPTSPQQVVSQVPVVEPPTEESPLVEPPSAESPHLELPFVEAAAPVQLVQSKAAQPLPVQALQGSSLMMGGDSTAALRLPHPGFAAPSAPAVEQSESSRNPWRIAGLSLLALSVVVVGGAVGAYVSWRSSGQLADGLIIQGQPVGGLTKAQARQRLEEHFGRLFVTVETPEKPYKLGLSELGGHPQIDHIVQNAYWYGRSGSLLNNMMKVYDTRRNEHRITLPVQWDKVQLRKKMWIVATQYKQKPRNAKLEVNEEGVHIIPHQEGRAINVGETLKKLQHSYYVGLVAVPATVERVMPRLTAASLAGTDVKLGEYPTHFDSGQVGRTKNLHIAAAAVNGKVVMPGELFSFNKCTGERTWDKGYRTAHIFVHQPGEEKAQVVEGLAGGTCQVSSTLFNALRRANKQIGGQLRIVQREHHSLPVTYVPDGLDATVAWPDKDFKFRNNLSYPVYIRTAVQGERIAVSLWARVPQNVDSIIVSDNATPPKTAIDAEKAAQTVTQRASATKSTAVESVKTGQG
ncbi:MAG: VanW family protein [Abitibacteriaceae bacterium]|nr:VanW family protein [Abditibacteriaceae bacterium]MBV9864076.1 VanW family protein [Abditibacteriaceae bacterium]